MSSLALAIDGHPISGPQAPDAKLMLGQGFKTWTVPYAGWGAPATMASGNLYLSPVWFDAGIPIRNVVILTGPAGSGITLTRFGIYGYNSRALVASSADATGLMGANMTTQIPLSTPWTPTVSGLYLSGLIQVGTTPVNVAGTSPGTFGGIPFAAWAFQQTGLSDLPATTTATAVSARLIHFAAN
jgi:hypothetical protein